jgi:hypothetical protein
MASDPIRFQGTDGVSVPAIAVSATNPLPVTGGFDLLLVKN